jgi:hypothetical protein
MQNRSENQHCSVPAIIDNVFGGLEMPLFNTCLTVQHDIVLQGPHQQQEGQGQGRNTILRILESNDPTEVSNNSLIASSISQASYFFLYHAVSRPSWGLQVRYLSGYYPVAFACRSRATAFDFGLLG